jgi:hypothetical protein
MIDWVYVGIQATWILGASTSLAVFSIAVYCASEMKTSLGVILRGKGYRLALDIGGLLFCTGLGASVATWWEKALWGLLVVVLLINAWLDLKKK